MTSESISAILKAADPDIGPIKTRYILQLATGLSIDQQQPFSVFAKEVVSTDRLLYVNSYLNSWSNKKSTASYISALSALSTSCDHMAFVKVLGVEGAAALKQRAIDIASHIKASKDFFTNKLLIDKAPVELSDSESDSEGNDDTSSDDDIEEQAVTTVQQPVKTVKAGQTTSQQVARHTADAPKNLLALQQDYAKLKKIIKILMNHIKEREPHVYETVSKLSDIILES